MPWRVGKISTEFNAFAFDRRMRHREGRHAKIEDQARCCKALQKNRVRKNYQEQSFRQPHSDQENHQEKKKHTEIRGDQFREREEHQQTHSLSVEGSTGKRESNFFVKARLNHA
jgi:hypothetical protein